MWDLLSKIVIAVLTTITISVIGYCVTKFKAVNKKQNAIEKGVQALLRDRIIQIYNHYNKEKYIPIYSRENISNLHNEYKALGGNGTVDGLVSSLMLLPTDRDYDADD